MDLILIPAILHMPTTQFHEQHWLVQERTRRLLKYYIGAGWGGNPAMIDRGAAPASL